MIGLYSSTELPSAQHREVSHFLTFSLLTFRFLVIGINCYQNSSIVI